MLKVERILEIDKIHIDSEPIHIPDMDLIREIVELLLPGERSENKS
jgi:hypothetical protein